MMAALRIIVELTLEAQSRLAIHSGALGPKQEGAGQLQLAARDCNQKPWIPASSIKGMLRARYGGGDAAVLFGAVKDDGQGNIGAISFGNGWFEPQTSDDAPDAPAALVEQSRTAIDRQRGSPKHNHLFTSEAAPAKSCFKASFAIDVAGHGSGEEAAAALGRALAPLFTGVPLGSGKRQGLGRIKAAPDFTVQVFGVTGDGVGLFKDKAVKQAFANAAKAAAVEARKPVFEMALTLKAEEDYSHLGGQCRAEQPGRSQTTIGLRRDDAGNALLTGSTLLGALRSRAAWLEALDALRAAPADDATDVDRRFTPLADLAKTPQDRRDMAKLLPEMSSTERLFGMNGWAGLLEVTELELTNCGTVHDRTSTAIDRFTGGTLHGALYTTEVANRPAWRIALAVAPAAARLALWDGAMRKADLALLERLIADLERKGLTLGHGGAKGWGWMRLSRVDTNTEPEVAP